MKTAIVVLLGLVLLAAVGVGAYQFGVNTGLTQAQDIRTEFFRSRTGSADTTGDTTQNQLQAGQVPVGQLGQRAGGLAARNATNGTVKSVQGNVIQVTLRDGSTMNVTVDAQTVIQRIVVGTVADITSGESITVMSDQTGSTVTARTIQLRPAGSGGQ